MLMACPGVTVYLIGSNSPAELETYPSVAVSLVTQNIILSVRVTSLSEYVASG